MNEIIEVKSAVGGTRGKTIVFIPGQGVWRYEPKRSMTGYQARIIAKFFVLCTAREGALPDLKSWWNEVFPKTSEHWAKEGGE